MIVLEKACCCLELATGAAILGWLGTVGSSINIILSIVKLTEPDVPTGSIIFNIIVAMLGVAISIMLIRGAMMRNRRLVLPWLIVTIIDLAIGNIIMLLLLFSTGDINLIASIIITDLLIGYCWVCVYSFYKELEQNMGGVV